MPAALQPGHLDRRISIQRATVDYNLFNEPIETWSTLTTVWASKRDVSSGESVRAAEVNAEITTRFTIRYSSTSATISPTDRIVFDSQVYNITAVREIAGSRHHWIEIDAVRRADTLMETDD